MFLKELNFKSNILYNETRLMVSMNKALFIVGFLAIVFAGAFMISTSAVQADENVLTKVAAIQHQTQIQLFQPP